MVIGNDEVGSSILPCSTGLSVGDLKKFIVDVRSGWEPLRVLFRALRALNDATTDILVGIAGSPIEGDLSPKPCNT